mmetsp:Transcript_51968/g.103168  ORF Transcript_51968/g.103168 Transcript_51968/m.103168 type:complete len:416 (-) Transcript_51968:367-1614(-)
MQLAVCRGSRRRREHAGVDAGVSRMLWNFFPRRVVPQPRLFSSGHERVRVGHLDRHRRFCIILPFPDRFSQHTSTSTSIGVIFHRPPRRDGSGGGLFFLLRFLFPLVFFLLLPLPPVSFFLPLLEHEPLAHASTALQARQHSARVLKHQGAFCLAQQRRHHGLVLDGIQGAGRVHQKAADFQKVGSAHGDGKLNREQARPRVGAPGGHDARLLADGAVAAARHVGEHPVVHPVRVSCQRQTFRRLRDPLSLEGVLVQVGEKLSHVGRDHQSGGVQALALVRQHVRSLRVAVVGHHNPRRLARHHGPTTTSTSSPSPSSNSGGGAGLDDFQNLRGFRPGSCAGVEDEVVGLHLQHAGRDHGDGLLPGEHAAVRVPNQPRVQLLHHGVLGLADHVAVEAELKPAAFGKPRKRLHELH